MQIRSSYKLKLLPIVSIETSFPSRAGGRGWQNSLSSMWSSTVSPTKNPNSNLERFFITFWTLMSVKFYPKYYFFELTCLRNPPRWTPGDCSPWTHEDMSSPTMTQIPTSKIVFIFGKETFLSCWTIWCRKCN